MQFDYDTKSSSIIKVIGVGGGGTNAVSHMMEQGIVGVDFAICNTDHQSLEMSPVKTKIKLGPYLTEGRGAGNRPEVGKEACKESIEEIRAFLEDNTKMLFVTAGMGGGTGTGAAPIIARAAKELDILTVGIVTVPFTFEGPRRMHQALEGIQEMKDNVDALVVISNDRLKEIHGNLALSQAFGQADNVLSTAAKGIAEIITIPGIVNVDFEDVNTVMRNSGVAIMGTAIATGDDRAKRAVDAALHSPLIEDNEIRGAKHILLNITSGSKEVTMDEVTEITSYIQEEAGYGTVLIWGNCHDDKLDEEIMVTIIATGFERGGVNTEKREKIVIDIDEDETDFNPEPTVHTAEVDWAAPVVEKEHRTMDWEPIIKQESEEEKSGYGYDRPYVREEDRKSQEEQLKNKLKMEAERRERLRLINQKVTDPSAYQEMESEPAFKRRNVTLDDVPDSAGDISLSKWTLSMDDDAPEIRDTNAYLHDNVD